MLGSNFPPSGIENSAPTPACIAATATAVRRTPRSDWIALRDALTRGDNIEEGHFAERLWAVLLSPSPSKSVVSAVLAGGGSDYR